MSENWRKEKVKDLSTQYRGVTYKKSQVETFEEDDNILILRGGNIQDGNIEITNAEVYVNKSLVKDYQILQEGDILIVSSTGSKKLIGKAAQVKFNSSKVSFGAFITLLRPNYKVNKYLFGYFFQSNLYRDEIRNLSGGININNIRKSHLNDLTINLPSPSEQNQIVAKLDRLFESLNKAKAGLVRIPVILENFRKSVLTQAVTGRLTEEWRKEKGLPEWEIQTLEECSQNLKYGTSQKSHLTGSVPVLRMGNLQQGKIDWSNLKYTDDKSDIEKYDLQKGDLLFNRTNSPELVGKTSIFDGKQKAIYAGYIIRIRCTERLEPMYLNYLLNSHYGRKWAWEVKTDGVSQSNINSKKLAQFKFSLPSKDEQKQIIKSVDSLISKMDELKKLFLVMSNKVDMLPQSILYKAFRGEIVDVDPNANDTNYED